MTRRRRTAEGPVVPVPVPHMLLGEQVLYLEQIWHVRAAYEAPNGKPWLILSRPGLIKNLLVKADEVTPIRD